jgi:ribosome-associated toxin RatA of RatAB toxin-antitoxin module
VAEYAIDRMAVAARPEQCFAVVTDFERYKEWAADVKEVTVVRRDDEGRPSEVTFRVGAFGRSSSNTLSYDYSDSPRTLAWRQIAGDLTSKFDGSWRFEPAPGGGTDVTYSLEVELRVPLPGFIKRRAQSRIMHTALEELKTRVESSLTT